MIVNRALGPYIVYCEDSILNALAKITDNKKRFVFSLTEGRVLEGILTDGDFRRSITDNNEIDLNRPVSTITNKNFVSARVDDPPESISRLLNNRIAQIPLLDERGHLVAFAYSGRASFHIGDVEIGPDTPAYIIAEIGNNHNGDLDAARRLIDAAAEAGADAVKFQMRNLETLYRSSDDPRVSSEDLGAEYTLDLLRRFNLSPEHLFQLFDYAKEGGLNPLCTPWDISSLTALDEYGILAIKIASADLTNHELLTAAANLKLPVICSTGMATETEIIQAVELFRAVDAEYALLHCNSTYPTPLQDINLLYLGRLREIGDCVVGYSGHEHGWHVPIAAVAMGARIIEKHFTLDRSLEGNDHKISLLPNEFAQMVAAIRDVEQAVGDANMRKVTQGERINRESLAKSLVAARHIRKGEQLTFDCIEIRSPGRGLPPYQRIELIGKTARRDFRPGDFFFESDLGNLSAQPRHYSFRRAFGLPVRYHDMKSLEASTNLDLVEFHLSYVDLKSDPSGALESNEDLAFVVHCPELFSGDHILDLASPDAHYRERSVDELRKIVDLTLRLKAFFPNTERPLIVVNCGGWTKHGHQTTEERRAGYDRVVTSLESIDSRGLELVIQTMPPFPWHFGGRNYHNLFVDPEEIRKFADSNNVRTCFDVSHSKLACNHYGWSLRDFIEGIGSSIAHIHISDALGTDGEGLQIGEGEIDFSSVADALDRSAPQASFIPEIWQGHKDGGAGFWVALDRLEAWF